jgi:hypothetical protein
MNRLIRFSLISLALAVLTGCAHPIVITPQLSNLNDAQIVPMKKSVGYYISEADLALKVITPGGGGDKVAYFPYKELEPALQKVLFNMFDKVERLSSLSDTATMAQKNLTYVFVPSIKTDSSSSGFFTWMPTNFTVTLACKALSPSGETLWSREFNGSGTAVTKELLGDFSLAAKRASEQAFVEFQRSLSTAPELHEGAAPRTE